MSRILIVGAGPAGIRAAQVLAAAGLRPVVVDEGARAGGQIYRRPPEGFTRPPQALYGFAAGQAVDLHRSFDALVAACAVDYRPLTTLVGLIDGVAQLAGPAGVEPLAYDRLILATGATDRLAPVPGWQSPGVYSLGAAQIALKAQGVALGRQIVLAGSGPLLTLVAHQLKRAGAGLVAVLDTAPRAAQFRGGLRMALARPVVTARGMAMRAGLGRLYHAGVRLERIEADAAGVTAIRWTDAQGRAQRSACDTVAMGWHLRSETQLADLAGARFAWDAGWQQFLPAMDAMGRAGPGLYLAGDGCRLAGADAAELAGRLAAIACLADLGQAAPDPAADLRRLGRMLRFARGLAQAFPWPAEAIRALPDDSIICRCEGITAGELRLENTRVGPEINRVKSQSRLGMGRCQGRYCQLAGAEIIAAGRGMAPADVGRLRGQSPVKPLPAHLLARHHLPDPGPAAADSAAAS